MGLLWNFYGKSWDLSNKVAGFPWGKYGDLTSPELEVELGNTDFGEQFTTIIWLVVWNIFFSYIGNFIIPTDELHHFQRGRSTTNQYKFRGYILISIDLSVPISIYPCYSLQFTTIIVDE